MPVDNLPSRSSVLSEPCDGTLIGTDTTNPVVQEFCRMADEIANEIADEIVGNVIGRDGTPMQQFDPIDNLPDGIRDEYQLLMLAIERCPDIELANSARMAANDSIVHGGGDHTAIRNFFEYLNSVVSGNSPSRSNTTEERTFASDDLVQARANIADKRSKLFAPIGLELSYHAPIKKKTDGNIFISVENVFNNIAIGGTSNDIYDFSQLDERTRRRPDQEPVPCRPEQEQEQEPVDNIAIGTSVLNTNAIPDLDGVLDGVSDTESEIDSIHEMQIEIDRIDRLEQLQDELEQLQDELEQPQDEPVRCITHLDYTNKLRGILLDAGMLKDYGSKVYKDCGDVIEVCTPIHKNWKSMRDWFAKTNALARANKFLPWKKTSGGGGMHMNISYNKTVPNWKLAYTNFFILIASHPELNWIFNEPSDNHTANALVINDRFIRAYHEMATHSMTLTDDLWTDISVCGGKGYSINCKSRFHFELRTFEMVRSSQELHDTIMLVNAMLGFCMEVAEWGVMLPLEVDVPIRYVDDAAEIRGYMLSQDRDEEKYVFDKLMWTGEASFNQMVRDLGLDPKTYRKYVQRNYYTRRGAPYGKKYMS